MLRIVDRRFVLEKAEKERFVKLMLEYEGFCEVRVFTYWAACWWKERNRRWGRWRRLSGRGAGWSDSEDVEARTLLLIADDLGLSTGINAAVQRAHREGGLQAASLMLGQAASDEAVVLARESPPLQVGWHLHVCDSQPLTYGSWPWGRSALLAGLAMTVWPAARRLVRRELRRQWAAFGESGLPCRFINGHHHLHLHPVVLEELEQMIPPSRRPWLRGFNIRRFGQEQERVPARRRRSGCGRFEHWISPWVSELLRRRRGWTTSDSVWGLDRHCAMDCREVMEASRQSPDGLHEFLFHPRQADAEVDADFAALMGLRDWPAACREQG